jgi:acetoin utilization deacetylase AcuC-like enzyme
MSLSGKAFIAYHPIYAHPLPEGHRFPMLKYELIPGQLQHEGSVLPEHIFSPSVCPDDVVLFTHDANYFHKLKNLQLSVREERQIGFPQSALLTERELMITQGTIDCCTIALKKGVALNIAGGTHHAYADRGEGFCLLNDFAVAANYLLHNYIAKRILIIDLDVHQGNGTAKIFEHNPSVFTFSMHGAHNYPFRKEKSDLDIGLEDGIKDDAYLSLLDHHLTTIIDTFNPDFAFYLSGVDILESDKFGKLKITMAGCRERDRMVFTALKKYKIPCVVSMGGGYSPDVRVIVEAHCNTFREAISLYSLI